MPEWVSPLCVLIVIPAFGLLLKWFDAKADTRSKNAKKEREEQEAQREEARTSFDTLLLEGILYIGDLAEANARFSLNPGSSEAQNRLEKKQSEYANFRKTVNSFKTKQTIGTLQN